MATVDRAVRRAAADFAPMEGLVLAVTGREDLDGRPGRRRIVLVVTDRRVLLVAVRGGPPVDVTAGAADAAAGDGPTFEFTADGETRRWHAAADHDRVALLRCHLRSRRPSSRGTTSPGVRLVG